MQVSVLRYEVELTTTGYLCLGVELASTRFPNDAVLATVDGDDLLLWPTSGSFAGGLLLKQRNAAGDRSVLISEFVPAGTPAGKKEAHWDERWHALRVALNSPVPRQAVGANTSIEEQNGRWVVFLEIGFWETAEDAPLKVTRRRINDYATRRDAEIAAAWIQRSVDRNVGRPAEGS